MNDHIVNFMNITSTSRDEAIFYLNSANKNLELAISLFMDTNSSKSLKQNHEFTSKNGQQFEDHEIAPPILPKRAILVENDDQLYFRKNAARKKDSVFSFRDFNAETRDIEQKMNAQTLGTNNKINHLERLFRPPLSIMHRGTFESAKSVACTEKKWLMVDLHDSTEFCCQILNRDVWSQELIKSIVREQFLFLQLDTDFKEGIQFKCFYKARRYPAIYIIDPRTGEEMLQINESDLQNIITAISDFLQENPTFDNGTSPSHDVQKSKHTLDNDIIYCPLLSRPKDLSPPPNDKPSTSRFSESDNLAEDEEIVILPPSPPSPTYISGQIKRKSTDPTRAMDTCPLSQCGKRLKISEESLVNSPKASSPTGADDKLKNGPNIDTYTFQIKFPDDTRKIVTFPQNSQLKDLLDYTVSLGYPWDKYELIKNFPSTIISNFDLKSTLEECGLAFRETLYVQESSS